MSKVRQCQAEGQKIGTGPNLSVNLRIQSHKSTSEARLRFSRRTAFLVPAAAVVALLIASCRREGSDPFAAVLRPRLPRPTEGRLAGYPYAPWGRPAKAWAQADSDRAKVVAGGWMQLPRTRGAAELLRGKATAAVVAVEALVAANDGDAAAWSDLAAARLEAARAGHDPASLVRALDAADQALDRKPDLPEALFNRAVVLDAIGLRTLGRRAWQRYLAADRTSAWSEEAGHRLAVDQRLSHIDKWDVASEDLLNAAARGDRSRVAGIVEAFPEEARTFSEGDYLGRWAELTTSDSAKAETLLQGIEVIGETLRATNGDTFVADATAAIRRGNAETLAQAHRLYREGRKTYADRQVVAAQPMLQKALILFQKAHSPMELVTRYFFANTLLDASKNAEVVTALDSIAPSDGYRALRANILRTRGTALTRLGRLHEALDDLTRSVSLFEAMGERDSASRVRVGVAGLASRLGLTADVWRLRLQTFRDSSDIGWSDAIELALNAAARGEIRDKQHDTARALFTAQLDVEPSSPRLRYDALLWKTYLDEQKSGEGSFDELRKTVAVIKDPLLRADAVDDVRFAEAMTLVEKDPRRARTLLDETVAFRTTMKRPLRVSQALVERAAASRRMRDDAAATRDLESAIALIENQSSTLRGDDLRDSFLGASERAFRDLADIALTHGDYTRAYDAIERSRSRVLAERLRTAASAAPVVSPAAAAAQLPAGTVVAEIVTLSDRTAVIVVRKGGITASTVPHGEAWIRHAASRFAAASASHTEVPTADTLSEGLFDTLVRPAISAERAAGSLVIVPDAATERIPFAALRDPVTKRYLIEDRILVTAPSLSFYLRSKDLPASGSGREPLLIGDPAFGTNEVTRSLPRLPEANDEVRRISRLYSRATVLTSEAATKAQVIAAIADRSIVQLAAHAVVNDVDPSLSCLVLTPSNGDNGLLTAGEIARLQLKATPLVLLAGCRTGSAVAGNSSTRSLAGAFLFAGARSTVATLWNIDDAVGRDLSLAVHRDLRSGVSIAVAVRNAQLAMLHGADVRRRSPRAWSAFQVYGGNQ